MKRRKRMERNNAEALEKELVYKRKNAFLEMKKEDIDNAFSYSEGYKRFLDSSKTEREAVKTALEMAVKAGYQPFESGKKYKAGDKIYLVNRGKAVIFAKIGSENLEKGVLIAAAHIDSPRLDLKPNPFYESENMSYLETHYYGGIKKYQWVTLPLAMHGVIVKKNGECVEINIGEDENDPVFYITDLLPHLSAEQNKKTLAEGISGESLNILVGSMPIGDGKTSNAVKLNTLKLINEKYSVTEEDFMSAEIALVPAGRARDIGFDRSLISAYGHDDRVCAYPALTALLDSGDSKKTLVTCLTDKEEVGSMGNTGLNSSYLYDFLEELAISLDANPRTMLRNSKCLSADVNAAYDPQFAEVYEKNNASFVNAGLVVTKYTGVRGKSSSSEASAEFVSEIRRVFDEGGVIWQMGELGKVDVGGGGTVAQYVANRNIDVVDVGVSVLSMHAPFEAISKLDLYSTYKGIKVFFEKMI